MFGISGIEFLFIGLFALIIFGPDKLPQFGRTIGQILRQFNAAKEQMEQLVHAEMYASDTDKATSPFAPPSSPFSSTAAKPETPTEQPAVAEYADDEEEEEE